MSLSFGSSKKKGTTSQTTNPWAPTIPGLESLVSDITGFSKTGVGPTSDQLDAFQQLKDNAAQGDPNAANIAQLSADMFGANSRSGDVDAAYQELAGRMGGVADGNNLNVEDNPYLQGMLQTVGDDIFNRIGSQFAGAGRDITGNAAGLKAVGRGISEGTLPTLFNQYNLERQNQSNAANQLFGARTGAATTAQGLDKDALATRSGGIATGQAALDAQNYGPNTILNLEEQMKDMPAEDLALYTQLLGSIAGLGGQSLGTSKQSGTSFGLGANLLSDERAKEGPDGGAPEVVGELANGTKIYRYRYKAQGGEGPVQIGVMAQEVERDTPDAVTEAEGVKFVDYDMATDESARAMKKKKKGGGKDYA